MYSRQYFVFKVEIVCSRRTVSVFRRSVGVFRRSVGVFSRSVDMFEVRCKFVSCAMVERWRTPV